MRRPPSPRPISPFRWHLFYAAVFLGLFSTISLGRLGVGQRIGDGTGFYIMFFSWAENGTPWSKERVGGKFVQYTKARPTWEGQQHYYSKSNPMLRGGTADESHFWLYSALAAIFYWPLKLFGADVGLSFNCLHIALVYVAAVLIHRRVGPTGVFALAALVVGSPVLWYANKAHTELFTVVLGCLGAAYFVTGDQIAAAICYAVVATQNPAFGLVALLAVGFGLVRPGWRALLASWKRLVVLAAILILHPAYYWFRERAASPMLIGPELLFHTHWLPLRHLASFWIDPDIGLLATWPLGLPLAIVGGTLLFQKRSRRRIEYALFCLLATLMLTWCCARLATGFGGGGTIDVSRYSVWLIGFFFPVAWQVVEWFTRRFRAERERRLSLRGSSAFFAKQTASLALRLLPRMLLFAAAGLVAFSAWLYRPELDEGCRRPTPQSEWLYAHASSLYDPLPRIFYRSRSDRVEKTGEDTSRWRDWAVSDSSGNKIFIWREAFERQSAESPAAVVGRGAIDPTALYAIARDYFAARPAAEYLYVNNRAAALFGPPPLELQKEVLFTDSIGGERLLDSGWYVPDDDGAWTRGERAEIVFRPQGVDPNRSYALNLAVEQVVGKQAAGQGRGPLTLTPELNGQRLAPMELLGPGALRWFVPADKLAATTTLALLIHDPASPRQLGIGSDPRQLGVKVRSLRLQQLGK